MKHHGKSFACYAMQDRNHEHKSLAGGETGGQGTCLSRSMYGSYGTSLRLHLGERDGLSKKILPSLSRPKIGVFCHGGRGCNGIDGGYLGEVVCDICCSFIAIHRYEFLLYIHFLILFSVEFYHNPSLRTASSRILYLRIFPAAFMGKESTNSM